MRSLLPTTVALLAATASLAAQSFESSFTLWPGVSQVTSRGGLGNGAGELLAGFPTNVVRGIGTASCACRIIGLRAALQGNSPSPATPFYFTVRTGTDATGPGASPASELARIGATFPARSSTAAYVFTVTPATPVATPCSGFLAAGVGLPALGPTGSGDLSVHSAFVVSGAMAHPAADDVTWEIPAGATSARHPAPPHVLRVELLLDTPTVEVGNVTASSNQPLYGLGGAFPDTTRTGVWSQGLALRCRAPGGSRSNVAIIAAWGFSPVPFPAPGVLTDCLFVDPLSLIDGVLATGLSDGTPIPIVSPGVNALPSLNGAAIVWQAIVLGGTLRATNAVATALE